MSCIHDCFRIHLVLRINLSINMILEIEEIFDIALRSLDRGILQIQDFKSDTHRKLDHLLDHFQVSALLTHHTFLADLLPVLPQTAV